MKEVGVWFEVGVYFLVWGKGGGIMKTTTKYKPNVEIVSDAETLAQRSIELFVADVKGDKDEKCIFHGHIRGTYAQTFLRAARRGAADKLSAMEQGSVVLG